MAGVVVVLDVGEVHGLGDSRPLVQLAQPVREVRIVLDAAQVALEMPVIYRIEANGSGEQAPIGLGQVLAGQVALLAQSPLHPVEFAKQLVEGFLVGVLGGGEPGAVHAVVDGRVDPRIERIDLAAQGLWVEIHGRAGEVVEGTVENADDLGGFIVDDALTIAIPQQRHGDAPGVAGIIAGVALMQIVEVVQRIAAGAGGLVERPAIFRHQPADYGHVDQLFEAFEFAVDQCAMRPGAGERDVEVVAARLGWKGRLATRARRAVPGYPVVTFGMLSFESAVAACVPAVMPLAIYQ